MTIALLALLAPITARAEEVGQEAAIQIAKQYLTKHGYTEGSTASEKADERYAQPAPSSLEATSYRVEDAVTFWSIIFRVREHPETGWQVAVVKKSGKLLQPPAAVPLRLPPGTKVSRERAIAIAAVELVEKKRLSMEKLRDFWEVGVEKKELKDNDQPKGRPHWGVYLYHPHLQGGGSEVFVDEETGEVHSVIEME